MVELVDTQDLKSCGSNAVRVRFPLLVHSKASDFQGLFCFICFMFLLARIEYELLKSLFNPQAGRKIHLCGKPKPFAESGNIVLTCGLKNEKTEGVFAGNIISISPAEALLKVQEMKLMVKQLNYSTFKTLELSTLPP